MDFKLNPSPLNHPLFEINPKGGKYKTAEIEPFCIAHKIPMYDFRKEINYDDYENPEDIGYVECHPYSKVKEWDYYHNGEIIKMELTENERYTLYDGFEIKANSKGWFMVYKAENIRAYFDYKYNKGVE